MHRFIPGFLCLNWHFPTGASLACLWWYEYGRRHSAAALVRSTNLIGVRCPYWAAHSSMRDPCRSALRGHDALQGLFGFNDRSASFAGKRVSFRQLHGHRLWLAQARGATRITGLGTAEQRRWRKFVAQAAAKAGAWIPTARRRRCSKAGWRAALEPRCRLFTVPLQRFPSPWRPLWAEGAELGNGR